MPRILKIKCAKCGHTLMKYLKIGEGRLWHCWKKRILQDYTVKKGDEVRCPKCGALIGLDKGPYINIKQKAVTITR
ncbi:MAG: hypothetical protein DRJ35_05445 [Thermoprotei archaeon]|nr:MAG: hypothetical protein DRJ35_05445 [Thermoprotei archaeon]